VESLKIKNELLRKRFAEFLEDNYNPPLRTIHKAIGIGYSSLVSWNAGSLEYSFRNLEKIDSFLKSKGK